MQKAEARSSPMEPLNKQEETVQTLQQEELTLPASMSQLLLHASQLELFW
jgi:hypothetical protein